jgi:hypothetical protein
MTSLNNSLIIPISILFLVLLISLYYGISKEHFDAPKTILNPYGNTQVSGLKVNNPPKEVNDTLFIFANNKSDPRCCLNEYNSGYSTSRGCVCLTDQQKEYLTKNIVSKKC